MTPADDRIYLKHILDSIARIERYVRHGKDAFFAETQIQDAVLRNFHTLTESTQRISAVLRADYPDVDWHGMARFRNVVVHNYLGLDLVEVWGIIESELPTLKQQIADILQAMK